MQQIFSFIFKNSNRLLFFAAPGISLSLTIQITLVSWKLKIISSPPGILSGGVCGEKSK
jgi:rod shape-determining protein MreC